MPAMSDWLAANWPAAENIVAGTTLRNYDQPSLPLSGTPCWLNQVHGTNVVTAGRFGAPPDADGVVGRGAGSVCVVRSADCLPVLMCATDGSVFAAAHAGWRGLAAGILENTLAMLDLDPRQLLVWFGPAISQPSFEVGDEVRQEFLRSDPDAGDCFTANARQRWQADLYALARRRLQAAGVRNIFGGGLCTYLDRERFFSYRRNPECGRLVTFVGLRSP
jgi:purine-nucleoside/S-methyl-5'-thioadenosine phosphorylase / adenosine deaminase